MTSLGPSISANASPRKRSARSGLATRRPAAASKWRANDTPRRGRTVGGWPPNMTTLGSSSAVPARSTTEVLPQCQVAAERDHRHQVVFAECFEQLLDVGSYTQVPANARGVETGLNEQHHSPRRCRVERVVDRCGDYRSAASRCRRSWAAPGVGRSNRQPPPALPAAGSWPRSHRSGGWEGHRRPERSLGRRPRDCPR